MANRPRYVLDTNVIVSALLFPESTPGQAFFAARKSAEILLSEEVIEELSEVLRRQKFDRYLLPEERDHFLATLIRQATLLMPTETIRACRDPKDDKWLELAVEGKAVSIVSGDVDLLTLTSFRGIPIVTPTKFLESLAN